MTGPALKVDPKELQKAGSAFGQAAAGLAGLGAGAPLSSAAAGVPQLATASACHAAEESLTTQLDALTGAARTFGENLGSAADQYLGRDAAAAGALQDVQFPK